MNAPDVNTPPPEMPGEVRLALLWMLVAFGLVFIPFVIIAIRRATIGGRPPSKKSKPTVLTSAWEEAGQRLQVDGGAKRLDDTVDLDPFDFDSDGDRW